jgi:hypothetical protein
MTHPIHNGWIEGVLIKCLAINLLFEEVGFASVFISVLLKPNAVPGLSSAPV